MREAARLIAEAKRPVLYVGGGVIKARAHQELRRLAETHREPVTTTLMARGAFPDSHPLHLGMPGHARQRRRRARAAEEPTCSSRSAPASTTASPARLDSFAPDAMVIHADIDPAEIAKNRAADVPIVGDAREVIVDLVAAVLAEHEVGHVGDYAEWIDLLDHMKATYPLGYDLPDDGTLSPQYVIERIGDRRPGRDLRRRCRAAPDVGRAVRASTSCPARG